MGTIRRIDIQQIKNKLGINTFIETGTLYGDGVDFALEQGFNKIISIEINQSLFKKAQEKYENNPNVTILCGNSPDILEKILPDISEPVVFWLDAHFPGCDADLASYKDELDLTKKIPLEQELKLLKNRNKKDVIVCDDLWIYEDWRTGTGTFNEHCKMCGHDVTKEELNTDGVLLSFENMFKETHSMEKLYMDQGYIIFKPKL